MQNKKRRNAALESHALIHDPVYLAMKLYTDEKGHTGPRHTYSHPGAEVDENGDVTFYFYAPQAKSAAVAGLPDSIMTDKRYPMVKDEEGFWSVKVSGLEPGIHFHEYFVDDVSVLNPQTPIGYGLHRAINFFEIADPDFTDYLEKDVPHGSVTMELYPSSVTGRTRSCWVYTPQGYKEENETEYPVLYLMHGGGESETDWLWLGKVNYILDNLIAEGRCKKMIVVMNQLFCVDDRKEEEFLPGDFDSVLLKDCIPFIEKTYRVDKRDSMRAMAGLSMGSFQTIMTTHTHLGMFPYIGIFSGNLKMRWYCQQDFRKLYDNPGEWRDKVKVLFFGYGEQEDRIVNGLAPDLKMFDERNIPYHHYTCRGYHEWTVWRKCISEFLPLIFK